MGFAAFDNIEYGILGQDNGVYDMYYSIVSINIGNSDHGIINVNRAIHDGNGDLVSVQGDKAITGAQVGGHGPGAYHVIEEDLGQVTGGILQEGFHGTFGQGLKGSIGGSKYSERTSTAEVIGQFGSDYSSFQDGVIGTGHYNVKDSGRGNNNRVNNMNHAIVGHQVGGGHHGVVDIDLSVHDLYGNAVAIQGGDHLTVAQVSGHGPGTHHMVEEYLGQVTGRIFQQSCNGSFGEGLKGSIGGSKHGERTGTAEVIGKTCCNYSGFQGVVGFAAFDNIEYGILGQDNGVYDMYYSIVSINIGNSDHGIINVNRAIHDGNGDLVSVQGDKAITGAQVGGHGPGAYHVIEEDLGQVTGGILQEGFHGTFGQGLKGSIGGSKYGERTCTAEVIGKTCCNHSCFQGVVVLAAGDNVKNRILGQNDGIDYMNDSVISVQVGSADHCVININGSINNSHGDFVSVQGGEAVAAAQVSGHGLGTHHMVEEDLGQVTGGILQEGFHGTFGQGLKGSIGGSKYGERTCTAEVIGKTCCNHSCFQGVVVLAAGDNVINGVLGQDDGIDHMNDPVISVQVGNRYHGIINVNRAIHDGNGDLVSVQGGEAVTAAQVSGHGLGTHHMVKEDLGQVTRGILQQCIHGSFGKCVKGSIGGSKYSKRTCTGKVVIQFSGNNCSFKGSVVRTGNDDVHHGVLGQNVARGQSYQDHQKQSVDLGKYSVSLIYWYICFHDYNV